MYILFGVQLGHDAYRPGTVAYAKIIEEFGEGTCTIALHVFLCTLALDREAA